jgi:hypothetical protein
MQMPAILGKAKPDTYQIPSSVMTFKYQQLKKKAADSAPFTMFASLTEPPIQRRLRRYWLHDLLVRF